jgi:hypothetical protein
VNDIVQEQESWPPDPFVCSWVPGEVQWRRNFIHPATGGRMDVNKWSSIGSRVCFAVAFILFVVAILEWLLLRLGVAFAIGYRPGRLAEFAVMFLIPVMTVLLREIREELRKPK